MFHFVQCIKQTGAEMCQAHIKLWYGLAWHIFGLGWLGLVGCGLAWFVCLVKLNYQISLLALDGVGGGGGNQN